MICTDVKSQSFADQIGEPGAVVTLTVSNDALVFGNTLFREIFPGVIADAQTHVWIHQVGPFAVNGTRDMAELRRAAAPAMVFRRAACIPDKKVCLVQLAQDIRYLNDYRRIKRHRDLAPFYSRDFRGEWKLGCFPGVKTTVEVGVALVAVTIQGADQTAGPDAAFIVTENDVGIRRQAEQTEQSVELRPAGNFARHRRLIDQQQLWRDMH